MPPSFSDPLHQSTCITGHLLNVVSPARRDNLFNVVPSPYHAPVRCTHHPTSTIRRYPLIPAFTPVYRCFH